MQNVVTDSRVKCCTFIERPMSDLYLEIRRWPRFEQYLADRSAMSMVTGAGFAELLLLFLFFARLECEPRAI